MSTHIEAKKGEIADKILLPGDPLRAKHIADHFLTDVTCYNQVRGMLGYTGKYKGERVSVQGTGMGVPSISIYVNELIEAYDVKKMIRVGTCGALSHDVKVRDVILAQAATTDSQINQLVFNGIDYAPIANFKLLKDAYELGTTEGLNLHVGNVFTSDRFYREEALTLFKKLADYQVLGVEMETTALYTLAAKYNRQALSILTVSDHILTGEETSATERQTTFNDMITVALDTIIK